MEDLIPLVNKLHDAFSIIDSGANPVDLPQIVVVGSQSSGKSSVLENLVGKDFLPRGSGIVTRRPLILQLNHIKSKSISSIPSTSKDQANGFEPSLDFEWDENAVVEEYGEFLHIPNKRFYNFGEIREEINRETDRITGKNKGVSPIPINLKVYSPHVLNLTLVDLPGITKVPVGDQPKDIEIQIRRMIMQYIEKPNTIILAVSAANTDLANSDALQLAKLVDPEGRRTLGVITKLDLMDKGTDAYEILTGKVIPLQLGFVGVVNRSQKDINERKTIKDAIKSEQEFFSTHPVYKSVGKYCGTAYLGRRCADILVNHIRRCLPELKQKVLTLVSEQSKLLESLGDTAYDTNPGAMLLQIIHEFSERFNKTIDGQVEEEISISKLYGGARINYLFNQIFARHLQSLNALEGLSSNEIQTIIKNATGPRTALFVPEQAFDLLVRRQISKLKDPAILCVDLVEEELEKILNSIQFPRLERFTRLREELVVASTELLQFCQAPAREMISNIINMELSFINTSHPHFKVDDIITEVMTKRTQVTSSENPSSLQPPQPVVPPRKGSNPPTPVTTTTKDSVPINPIFQQPTSSSTQNNIFSAFFSGSQSKQKTGKPSKPDTKYYEDFGFFPPNQQQPQLEKVPEKISVNASGEKKEFEIELLEHLLLNYFDIVRTNILDAVPKAVMYFLVNKTKQEMQNVLIQKLYKEQSLSELLCEGPDVVQKRERCKTLLKLLGKAQIILNEVRDWNFNSGNKTTF